MNLLCLGDVALAEKELLKLVWDTPGNIKPSDEAKLLFNWELPLGVAINPTPRSSGARYLSQIKSPQILKKWSPAFVTLANNHILDAGIEGLDDTIDILNRLNFRTVGAGRTKKEIKAPLFWETKEGRLSIINWVFPETHPDWMFVPGPNCWPGYNKAKKIIDKIKNKADWIIIVVHWSDELFSYPRPQDRDIAQKLSKMGADLVIGHHPHVVRGMELIGLCPVFYSLGNFFFSNYSNGNYGFIKSQAPRNRESLGIQITFQRGKKPLCKILPFWRKGRRVVSDPVRRAARRMECTSVPLRKFSGNDYVEWYNAHRARFNKWGYRWHFKLKNMNKNDCKRLLSKYFSRILMSR
jgi:hypothetical protein